MVRMLFKKTIKRLLSQIIQVAQSFGMESTTERESSLCQTDHTSLLGKSAKEQTVHASKLAGIGELSASVAHEINNPLANIGLRTELLRGDLKRGDLSNEMAEQFLDELSGEVERITTIVRGLGSLRRDSHVDPFARASVRQIIDDVCKIISGHPKHAKLRVQFEPCSDALMIECRPIQIVQTLVILVDNASEATTSQTESWLRLEVEDHETSVWILVTDSGDGIANDIVPKLMKPFFTTKPADQGYGLGLSIGAGIARAHYGELVIDTESPNTRFILKLPKTQPVDQP